MSLFGFCGGQMLK